MGAVADTLHVSCGAVIGVLTRIGLGRLFGPRGLGAVSASSTLFLDLPSNALGSFLAGLTAHFKHPIVEVHESIHLALSAGFFGSVTTFASWNLQVVRMFADGHWTDAIFALFIGTYVSLSSYILGHDTGHGISAIASLQEKRNWIKHPLEMCRRELPRSYRSGDNAQLAKEYVREDMGLASDTRNVEALENGPQPEEGGETRRKSKKYDDSVATYGSLMAFSLLFAGLMALFFVDKDDVRHEIWLSSLIAPVGAILRWQLSRLNKIAPVFPLGTFAANVSASVLDYAVAAILLKLSPSHARGRMILESLITSVGGTLSTVSTWCGEVVSLRDDTNSRMWSYTYLICSILICQLLGIVIYGAVKWSE